MRFKGSEYPTFRGQRSIDLLLRGGKIQIFICPLPRIYLALRRPTILSVPLESYLALWMWDYQECIRIMAARLLSDKSEVLAHRRAPWEGTPSAEVGLQVGGERAPRGKDDVAGNRGQLAGWLGDESQSGSNKFSQRIMTSFGRAAEQTEGRSSISLLWARPFAGHRLLF